MDVRRSLTVLFCTTLACVGRPLGTGDDGQAESSSGSDEDSSSSSSESSTDTSESTSDSSDSADESETWDFVPSRDSHGGSCDPYAQDCPEGEKCVPYASSGGIWDAHKCVPVTGDGAVGDPCTSTGAVEATDDCGADSYCWDVMEIDGELWGTCVPFCGGTADAPTCPPNYSCIISGEGSLGLCITICDPLVQDCVVALGCFYTGSEFDCIPTTADIAEGDPCVEVNDCAAGNFCAAAATLPSCAGAACCASFCDLDLGPGQCAIVGTECVSFFEVGMAPPGYEHVGVCILPG